MHPNDQLFMIRSRIAADQDGAQAERMARAARRRDARDRASGPLAAGRAWLGRRLVAVGTAIAGGPPAGRDRETTGRPC